MDGSALAEMVSRLLCFLRVGCGAGEGVPATEAERSVLHRGVLFLTEPVVPPAVWQ